MTTQSNAATPRPLDAREIVPVAVSPTRPLYWSVRRELCEYRSIFLAPAVVAVIYLLGFFISLFWIPRIRHPLPENPTVALAMPYSHAAMLLMAVGFLVGVFYSLDALHSERRDRSILFWKSLPVSDLTTVLAKAIVPLVILPIVVFAITVILQLIMRLVSAAVLLLSSANAATLSAPLLFEMELVFLYSLIVLALWYAPLYMWLLLVSGWPRRATFLWAVLPPMAIAALEYVAFHTSYLRSLLQDRLYGFAAAAFDLKDKAGIPIDAHFIPLAQLAPGRFFSSPSLWTGLGVAAIFFAAAVRLRRYQGAL
jgi:ABC-2 type transport system permease protein